MLRQIKYQIYLLAWYIYQYIFRLVIIANMSHILDDQLLEKSLIVASQKRNVSKIKGRQSKKLINKGDYYVSLAWQEIVEVTNNQGDIWEERLIVKTLPECELTKQYIADEGLFEKEIKMYTDVLPKIEYLLKDIEKSSDRLWPRYIGMTPYNMLLLQDLTAKGYQKVDRHLGLDLEHSIFAFKAIAKFHILSAALRDELMLQSEEFVRFGPIENFRRSDYFLKKLQVLGNTMRNKWEPKWHRLADHLTNNAEEIIMRFKEICQLKDNNFNVLNHGDLWISNMLFKYSEFSGKLTGIRFIDFQLRHYGSFALDLQYLLHTSVQIDVLQNHMDDLLAAYHETLVTTARKLDSSNLIIPSLADIKAEMKDKIFYGLLMASLLLQIMLAEPLEELNLDTLQNKFINEIKPLPPKQQDRIRTILEPYINSDWSCL